MRVLMWVVIAGVFWAATTASAQSITGKWYGILEGYAVSNPRRILTISDVEGQLACTWDEVGASIGAAAKCKLENGVLDLVTSANNGVRRVVSDSTLNGTFLLTRNRGTLAVRMSREVTFPLATSRLSECFQTISYSISAPGAEVRPEFAVFSGVWVGKWNGVLCGALVVEEVTKKGDANVLYIWGHDGWVLPGRERFQAKISPAGRLSPSSRIGPFLGICFEWNQ